MCTVRAWLQILVSIWTDLKPTSLTWRVMVVLTLPQAKYRQSLSVTCSTKTVHIPCKETCYSYIYICQELCTFFSVVNTSFASNRGPSALSKKDVLFHFVSVCVFCLWVLACTFYNFSIKPSNNIYTDKKTLKSLLTVTTWCFFHHPKLWNSARFNCVTLLKSYICRGGSTCGWNGQQDRERDRKL